MEWYVFNAIIPLALLKNTNKMKKTITLLSLVFIFLGMHNNNINAQNKAKTNVTLVGTVVDSKTNQAIPYATVLIDGTTIGATSDNDGNYVIKNVPVGDNSVTASFLGYISQTKRINASAGKKLHIDFMLSSESVDLEQVVVTASRASVLRRLAPSLVTVMGKDNLKKTNSQTLSQGLRFLPGLRIEDNCQNCGFNQVRINGLEGAYSQVLVDSRPIMSSLAGVYGLEQIPSNMIERVEVIRGGGSALYGSNAVGGVINVITREPANNTASVDYTNTAISDSRHKINAWENSVNVNASIVTDDRKAGISAFGQFNYRQGLDYDGDGFTDAPNLRNRSLGFNAYYKPSNLSKIKLEFHSSHEHRRGGDDLDLPPFRSNIAEFLRHFNNGGSLTYSLSSADGKHNLELYTAAQRIERISYYGGGADMSKMVNTEYDDEYKKFLKNPANADEIDNLVDYLNSIKAPLNQYGNTKDLTFQGGAQYIFKFAKHFDLTLGAEGNYDKLNETTAYRTNPINQISRTLSQYHQLEYKVDDFTILAGGRLDYNKLMSGNEKKFDKLIYSPRFNVRYNPLKSTSIRASYSAGFRAPQFFDEEMHVELLGGAPVVRELSSDLKEERSHSVSLSVDHFGQINNDWGYNIMAEGFFTQLIDKFSSVDAGKNASGYDVRNVINVRDGAKVYGINIEGRIAYRKLFDLQAGYTWQRSRFGDLTEVPDGVLDENGEPIMSKDFFKTPNSYGYFIATVRPIKNLSFNLSGTFTGSMKVTHASVNTKELVDDLAALNGKSMFDEVINGQRYRGIGDGRGAVVVTKPFADIDLKVNYDILLYGSTMITLKAGIQNIFDSFQKDTDMGPLRASSYIYGPMLPRRFFVGFSYNI